MECLDKLASLTPAARAVICDRGTEPPHPRACDSWVKQGSYLCRRCGLALFRASSEFSASCGWPSFDNDISNAVKAVPDRDGIRTEICCNRCDGHLGHVFTGECFTEKNKRFCVNALSIDFVLDSTVVDTAEAILAGGCFWGVEYFMRLCPGVVDVEAGYTGGNIDYPTYNLVCGGDTGHYEAVRVLFDVSKTTAKKVLQYFFEIHDPTQANGQGVDLGTQYQSAVFYYDELQLEVISAVVESLRLSGCNVATKILPAQVFWLAEEEHQQYYLKHHKQPICHSYVSRFKED